VQLAYDLQTNCGLSAAVQTLSCMSVRADLCTISIYQPHRLCAELCGWYISHFPSFLYISLLTYLLPAAAAASAAASATMQLYCLLDSFIVTFFPLCSVLCVILLSRWHRCVHVAGAASAVAALIGGPGPPADAAAAPDLAAGARRGTAANAHLPS